MQSDEFQKLVQGPIVTIYVGLEQVRFILPKNLASRQCIHFKERFSEDSAENEDMMVNFPLDSPKTFAMLVQWIYQERFPLSGTQHCVGAFGTFLAHVELYNHAYAMEIPKLQNQTMEHLRALYITMRSKNPVDEHTIFSVYRDTDSMSLLRRFVCDAAAKAFLDEAKQKWRFECCLVEVSDFAAHFTEALHDYHTSQMDYIKDCPDRYTVDEEGVV